MKYDNSFVYTSVSTHESASIHSKLQYLRESCWALCHMRASIHFRLQYVRESCWLLSANSFGTHDSQHSFASSVCAKSASDLFSATASEHVVAKE